MAVVNANDFHFFMLEEICDDVLEPLQWSEPGSIVADSKGCRPISNPSDHGSDRMEEFLP